MAPSPSKQKVTITPTGSFSSDQGGLLRAERIQKDPSLVQTLDNHLKKLKAEDSQPDTVEDAEMSKLISSLSQTADEANALGQTAGKSSNVGSPDSSSDATSDVDQDNDLQTSDDSDDAASSDKEDDAIRSINDEETIKNIMSSLGQTSPQNFSDDDQTYKAHSTMSDADLDRMIVQLKGDNKKAENLYLAASNDTQGALKMNSLLESINTSNANVDAASDALLQETSAPDRGIEDTGKGKMSSR